MEKRRYVRTAIACALLALAGAARADVSQRVEALLRQMTLDEKVGQLNQLSGKDFSTGPGTDKVRDIERDIREGRIGSMLNIRGAAETRRVQALALQSRLHIPLLFGLDVIHGYRTVFPVPLGEAASWDLEAIEESARIAAREASAAGVHWTFAPMVDIGRDPRWGRVMEGAGEDSYLGARIAAARVRGFQGARLGGLESVMATAKHFAGYGAATAGRDYNAVDMSEHQLYETYLPPFKAAVDAGVATFMNSFNTLNGIPATGNAMLQRDILKGSWGFKGFVVSDWGSVREMVVHGYADDLPDAAAKAIAAGSDMDMESSAYAASLANLVRSGRVDVALVDDAVRRVLTKKFELGLFDDPYRFSDPAREKAALVDPRHRAAARRIAAESMVLLKNDAGALPLRKDARSFAVIGPLADARRDLEGGWIVDSNAATMASLVDAVRTHAGTGTRVAYAAGCDVACRGTDGFAAALDLARAADVVVLAVGESWDMSGEAKSRAHLGLPGRQAELFDALKAIGKTPVVVIMAGRPLIFENVAEGERRGECDRGRAVRGREPVGETAHDLPAQHGADPDRLPAIPDGPPRAGQREQCLPVRLHRFAEHAALRVRPWPELYDVRVRRPASIEHADGAGREDHAVLHAGQQRPRRGCRGRAVLPARPRGLRRAAGEGVEGFPARRIETGRAPHRQFHDRPRHAVVLRPQAGVGRRAGDVRADGGQRIG
jgi:beta-glucosidase